MRDTILAIIVIIMTCILFVAVGNSESKLRQECESKGGVLMKDATGLVVCVKTEVLK